VDDLELKVLKAKSEGYRPFLVVATAGTTVLGAFDSINDVADVCDKHTLWLHVDVRSNISQIPLGSSRHVSRRACQAVLFQHGGRAIVLACTSSVVFILLHTQILFVPSDKIY